MRSRDYSHSAWTILSRGSANWNPFGGSDQAFQIWWWIRGPGDTAELAFPAVTSQSEVGNVNTLTWGSLGTAAGPITATAVYTLTEVGSTNNISIELTLNYTGTDPVTYDVFFYADLDLNGSASGDSAAGTSMGSRLRKARRHLSNRCPGRTRFK